jgi:hypothetical protein
MSATAARVGFVMARILLLAALLSLMGQWIIERHERRIKNGNSEND